MHDLKAMRQDPAYFINGIARKGGQGVEEVLELDRARREILKELEDLRGQRNTVSEAIAQKKRKGEEAEADILKMRQVGDRVKELEERLREVEPELELKLASLPNVPAKDVPDGGEEANLEIRRHGTPREFSFEPKAHWDLGTDLGILDFERGAKVTGPRFPFLRGQGAKLERAIIAFMLDMQTKNGYEEIIPPLLVNRESAFGTGQLPKFEEDMFQTTDGYYLIPTAEVPVTNFRRDEIMAEEELPLKYCAYTPCFRSEAGAAGRDTRGLIRNHQFNKVELVKLVRPEESYAELESLLVDAESILKALELPYRVVLLATRDMTAGSAKTYDLEVWLPSSGTYREISSCSNFEAYQARRAAIRYRDQKGQVQHAHTLNGSGLAVGRTWAAIVENFQNEDGSVTIPEALRPYIGGLTRIQPT